MARKVYITVTTKIILDMDEGIELDEVMSDMDYNFKSQTDGVDVVDTEMQDYEVTDSK